MKKFKIPMLQFYITNACNLTCRDCVTFNNLKFKGHFYWDDNAEDYKKWSTLIDIDDLGIIGGEPFANPELLTWVKEIKSLWPNTPVAEIWTNGTYLKSKKSLAKKIIEEGFQIRVCTHDPAHHNEIKNHLEEILSYFNCVQVNDAPNIIGYYHKGKRLARLISTFSFIKTSQHHISRGIIYLHKSDADRAFSVCANECQYLLRGKMYRCEITAVAEDLIEQFNVDNDSASLLKEYVACSPWDDYNNIEKFINDLSCSIPQCSVCPEKKTLFPVWPLEKKKINL